MDLQKLALNKWFITLSVGLMTFATALDSGIVSVALPTIIKDFNASILDIEWIMNSFLVTAAVTFVVFGRLGDIFGKKAVFASGALLMVTGCLFTASAPAMWMIYLGRVLIGLSFACAMSLSTLIIVSAFPPNKRSIAVSINLMMTAIGMTISPYFSAIMLHFFTWRFIFIAIMPLGILSLILLLIIRHYQPDDRQSITLDLQGAGLVMLSVVLFVMGLTQLKSVANRPLGELLLAVSIAVTVLMLIVEHRKEHPFIDSRLFFIRNYSISIIMRMIININMMVTFTLIPLFTQNILLTS
ncbi:MAG: MFS transporter, partial [Coxiellaceae bacterium]|nr:MFS transporter [Coxiellaceae bacterium]